MAAPMIANLAAFLSEHKCPPLVLFNRTLSKLPPVSATIVHAESYADLAKRCDVVFSSLSEDNAVKSVFAAMFEGAREKKGKGVVFVETSTVYPTVAGASRARVGFRRRGKLMRSVPRRPRA